MTVKGLNDNQVTVNCGLSVGLLGKARRGDSDLGKKAIEKILNTYQEINRVWLLTGEGEMLKAPKNPFSQMTENEIEDIVTETFTERLMAAYKAGEIYPAEVHNRIVAEKDKRIEELQREVWELQKQKEK